MKGKLHFVIDASSVQKVTAVREKCAAWLAEEVGVLEQGQSMITRPFRVLGVDLKATTPKVFNQEIAADSAEAARAAVASATMIVVDVRDVAP